jgi:hypothetical protein
VEQQRPLLGTQVARRMQAPHVGLGATGWKAKKGRFGLNHRRGFACDYGSVEISFVSIYQAWICCHYPVSNFGPVLREPCHRCRDQTQFVKKIQYV